MHPNIYCVNRLLSSCLRLSVVAFVVLISPLRIASAQVAKVGEPVARTREEIDVLIDRVGRTPPEWFATTPLNFPKTLDLTWPERPEGPWNNQKNVGQFVWDIINPNPGRWREGVRLMHHLLVIHKDDAEKQAKIMNTLGIMYHHLLEDYPRAAFWWRKAGAEKQPESEYPRSGVHLAECYFRMGNKQMAMELLQRLPDYWHAVKLWADMGDIETALKLCDADLNNPDADQHSACLYAGDACRTVGRYADALKYYEKMLALPVPQSPNGNQTRNINRARASRDAIKLFELSDVGRVPDGKYTASSLGYEAQVQVEVAVKNHRIDSVKVTEHREKQFYAALTDTPRKIIAKQSVKGVDATSSATITSEAIINATAKALAAAAK